MSPSRYLSPWSTTRPLIRKAFIRYFVMVFLPTSLLLCGIFFAFTRLTKHYELQTNLIREASELKNASHLTSMLLDHKLADLFVLAEGETLSNYLHDESITNWIHLNRQFALFARRKPEYSQIRFIDTMGNELVRVNSHSGTQKIVPKGELQNKSHRYYFNLALQLKHGEVYISPTDLNVEHGEIVKPFEPTIRFGTPAFDGYGNKRGIMIINYSPEELLQSLINTFEPLLGDAMILNPKGYWLAGMPENMLWGFMFNNQNTFAKKYPRVWQKMSETDYGILDTDSGIFVFHKCPLFNLGHIGVPENLALPDNKEISDRDTPYWILLSHITYPMVDQLTPGLSIISYVTYLSLLLVSGFISYRFAKTTVQKKIVYLQLQELAVTDELTGISNRRVLNKVGQSEFLRAQRFHRPLSIMMIDIDQFKRVNDSFGHSMGDSVLKHISSICQSTIRLQDILARFGGEEFVILMPETEINGAYDLAERLCTNVRTHAFHYKEGDIPITVSIGVSSLNNNDKDYQELFTRADNALYKAKNRGRDRVEVAVEDDDLIKFSISPGS